MEGDAELSGVPCSAVIPWNPGAGRAFRSKPERFSAIANEVECAEIGAGRVYFGVFIGNLVSSYSQGYRRKPKSWERG